MGWVQASDWRAWIDNVVYTQGLVLSKLVRDFKLYKNVNKCLDADNNKKCLICQLSSDFIINTCYTCAA